MANWKGNQMFNNFDEKHTLNNILVGGDGNGHKILILKMDNEELKDYLKFCKLNKQVNIKEDGDYGN